MATFDPTRLFSTLLNTGLQVKDNALYQVIHDLIAALATINKQTNTLAASSSTPSVVTNIIQQLLDSSSSDLSALDDFQIPGPQGFQGPQGIPGTSGTGTGIPGQDGEDGVGDFQIPGPIGPAGPIVPYHIGINEVFLVPLYKQALFAMNIDNEGTIEVNGFLIEVEEEEIVPPAGGGTGTSTVFTQGSVVFAGASGIYSQNNGSFRWDNAKNRLIIQEAAANPVLTSTGGFTQVQIIEVANANNWAFGVINTTFSTDIDKALQLTQANDGSAFISTQLAFFALWPTTGNLGVGLFADPDTGSTLSFGIAGRFCKNVSVVTKGLVGVSTTYGANRATGQTAANASVATYTNAASDGSFLVSMNILMTVFSAGTISGVVDYTDEGGTARSLTLNFSSVAGVLATTIGATGAFEGVPMHIRVKASTVITCKTTAAGFTGTYNVDGVISQVA